MSLAEAASLVGGRLHGADARFSGLDTDSRRIASGALFVALAGERFDGHDFVSEAVRRGAAGALVQAPVNADAPTVSVEDTLAAMGSLAGAWRARHDLPVVAITGSNGKTTVKEMVAAILRRSGTVLATAGNLNNEIGVPLTLTRLGAEHRAAVVEMGANHPGEIARLTAMTRPTVGVITLCAPAHLEGFGSVEGVARAKGELYAGLDAGAAAVLNADDRFAPLWRELIGERRTVTFGLENDADVGASWEGGPDGSRITLRVGAREATLRIALPGRHNVHNAVAAAAAAHACGVGLDDIAAGLAAMRAVPGRLQLRRFGTGLTIIDDTYNANPGSVRAALEVLRGCEGPRWLALGDMAELGEGAREMHAEVGAYARECGVHRLLAVGPLGEATVRAFGAGATHCPDLEALLRILGESLPEDASLLVKGSRSAAMERVVEALRSIHDPEEETCC